MRNPSQNSERVDFRATPDIKQLIERAASIMGLDVSSYLRATVVPAAQQVIENHETRLLSTKDRDLFLALLDKPTRPNKALTRAAKNFRDSVESGQIHL